MTPTQRPTRAPTTAPTLAPTTTRRRLRGEGISFQEGNEENESRKTNIAQH